MKLLFFTIMQASSEMKMILTHQNIKPSISYSAFLFELTSYERTLRLI